MTKRASDFSLSAPVVFLIYLGLGSLVFHKLFNTWFLSDDLVIFNLISLHPFGYVEGGFFRPLCDITNFLTWQIWGMDPLPYKLGNLFIHILSSVVVFLLGKEIIGMDDEVEKRDFYKWLPFICGLLFLIWPIRSESVFWGAGRASSFSFLLVGLSLLFLIRYLKNGKTFSIVFSFLLFFLSLFVYESVYSFPLITLIFVWLFRGVDVKGNGTFSRKGIIPIVAYFLILGIYFLIRYSITSEVLGGYGDRFHLRLNLNILRNIIVFPLKTLLGAGFYSKTGFLVMGGLTVVVLAILKFKYLFREKKGKIPVLFFVLIGANIAAWIPVLNLSMGVADTQFDRYLYFPSFFTLITLVLFLAHIIKQQKLFFGVVGCLILYAIVTSYWQYSNWQKASHLTKSILDEVHEMSEPGDRIVMLNLPDNFCGAYLLRNGIHEGLRIFYPEKPKREIEVVGLHAIESMNNEIEVVKNGNEVDVQLRGYEGELNFEVKKSDLLEVFDIREDGYKVRLVGEAEVLFWNGQVEKLE